MHMQTVRWRNFNAELWNVRRHQSFAIETCQDRLCQIIRWARQEDRRSRWSQGEITKGFDGFYDGEHKLLTHAIFFIFRLTQATTCTTKLCWTTARWTMCHFIISTTQHHAGLPKNESSSNRISTTVQTCWTGRTTVQNSKLTNCSTTHNTSAAQQIFGQTQTVFWWGEMRVKK